MQYFFWNADIELRFERSKAVKNKSLTTIKHQYKLHEIALKEILISSNIRFIIW